MVDQRWLSPGHYDVIVKETLLNVLFTYLHGSILGIDLCCFKGSFSRKGAFLPRDFCGENVPVPQSLSKPPAPGQRA